MGRITVEEERRRANERQRIRYANRTPEQIAHDKEREHQRWLNLSEEKKEARRKRNRSYYHQNKDRFNTEEAKQKRLAYQRQWRLNNPDYYKQAYEKRREYLKQWRAEHPDYHKNRRRKIKEGMEIKHRKTEDMQFVSVGATRQQEKSLDKKKSICGMSVEAYFAMKKEEVRRILNY